MIKILNNILYFLLILFPVLNFGCSSGSDTNSNRIRIGPVNDHPFQVSVRDQFNKPVSNAIIKGGFDWTAYSVNTDSNGIALLPEFASGVGALIYKSNYIPLYIANTSSKQYILSETSKFLDSLGKVDGKVIRFDENKILTLDYQGIYRVYNYDEKYVTEIVSQKLNDSVIAIKHFQILNDTLWISTHSAGIYAFLINDILSPRLLYHLYVEGTVGEFIVKDSILAVIYPGWSPGFLRLLAFSNDNEFHELSKIETDVIPTHRENSYMNLTNNYLTLLGLEYLPSIYDISDPYLPHLLYNTHDSIYENGIFYKNYLILVPKINYEKIFDTLSYKIISLSDCDNLNLFSSFNSNIIIKGLTSDSSAYGFYYTDEIFSVVEGSINSSFSVTATAVDAIYDEDERIAGVRPPYFVFGSGLWKLINR